MSRHCSSNDKSFRPEGAWQRLCWSGWRELREQAQQPPHSGRLAGRRRPAQKGDAFCHPDRHPPVRAEVCHRVTAALTVALIAVREAA